MKTLEVIRDFCEQGLRFKYIYNIICTCQECGEDDMTDQQPFPQNYATNEPFFTSTSSRCHQHDVLISPPGTGIYSYIHRYPESNAKNCHSNGIEQQAVDVPLRHVSHAGCIIIPASRQRCEPSWNTSVCWYRSTQVGMALCDLVSL